MKKIWYNILYILGTFMPVCSIIGISADALWFLSNLNNRNSKRTSVIAGTVCIILLIILFVSNKIRVLAREHVEYTASHQSKEYSRGYYGLSKKKRDEIEQAQFLDNQRILDSKQLQNMKKAGEKDPDKAMENLIGLASVKQEMKEMAARMQYNKENHIHDTDSLSMHMCFIGPPGTGKTTCARIMTGYLYRYGYIKKNFCIETDGNFLKGLSKGETSKKTSMLIDAAKGGVLFIDEAYALLNEEDGGYGQEAIATLIKFMEDERGKFVLILAGYDNEMKTLINSNPGFFSRIKRYMWFESYSISDLNDIFIYMAGQNNFCVSMDALEAFDERMKKEMATKNFGNARSVRNCLEKAIDKHASNIISGILPADKKFYLSKEDIEINRKEDKFF